MVRSALTLLNSQMSSSRAISIDRLRKCWFLAGPTAVGKTELSLRLAELLNAEILSLDSMAIYCGMDIGTAKPDARTQAAVPHHLIDLVTVDQEFSVADYLSKAAQAVAEILNRGKTPLFVGGTGLYLRTLLRGVFDGPEADWELRQRLSEQAESHGNQWLHDRLAEVDTATAKRLHPNDVRRVIRAIEVFEATGVPISVQQKETPLPEGDRPNCFWLDPCRTWLHGRIESRVDLMIESGLIEEARWLIEHQPPPGQTALQALGYRELFPFLEGIQSVAVATEQIKINTRQFAKRQHTWFRNLDECDAVPVGPDTSIEQVLEEIQRLSGTHF